MNSVLFLFIAPYYQRTLCYKVSITYLQGPDGRMMQGGGQFMAQRMPQQAPPGQPPPGQYQGGMGQQYNYSQH